MQAESQIDSCALYADDMQTGRPTTTERTDFGTRLHSLREAAGLTQQEVAEQLGIAQSSYATWERQTPAIRPDQLERLAEHDLPDHFDVSVLDFFDPNAPEWLLPGAAQTADLVAGGVDRLIVTVWPARDIDAMRWVGERL